MSNRPLTSSLPTSLHRFGERFSKGSRSTCLLVLLAFALLLSACNTTTSPAPTLDTAADAPAFEFKVDPAAETVTPLEPATPVQLQAQAEPGKSRVLVPNVDIALRDLSFEFTTPDTLEVLFAVENITDDLDFTQPFFFTLGSASKNLVDASAPLVTDEQLGGDGVLSPGETSDVFAFMVTFKEDEPFTFSVDARASVVERVACKDPISIPDGNLEAAVREALDKSDGELTCEDLASLKELEAESRSISRVDGLQFAVNLTSLKLSSVFRFSRNNTVSDLSPLENLTKLTSLELNGNGLSDLSPLEGLTNLTFLGISGNRIKEIKSLESLTNLETLFLAGNSVSDLAPLEGLTNLTLLILSDNNISDITPLENLSNLISLNLDFNDVSDLTPLQNLADLKALELSYNRVEDLTPLMNLTEMVTLDLGNNVISTIAVLDNLTNLTFLDVGGNSVSDIAELGKLTKLTKLDLAQNDVSDISSLENLTDLASLFLTGNNISDISALVNNSGVGAGDRLNIGGNPLSPQALKDVELLRERGVTIPAFIR